MCRVESAVNPTHPSTELTKPSVDAVVAVAGGKFMAVTLAARRARALGEYFAGHTLPNEVPPQVPARSMHPLSIALDEVVDGKIVSRPVSRAEYVAAKYAHVLPTADPDTASNAVDPAAQGAASTQ